MVQRVLIKRQCKETRRNLRPKQEIGLVHVVQKREELVHPVALKTQTRHCLAFSSSAPPGASLSGWKPFLYPCCPFLSQCHKNGIFPLLLVKVLRETEPAWVTCSPDFRKVKHSDSGPYVFLNLNTELYYYGWLDVDQFPWKQRFPKPH